MGNKLLTIKSSDGGTTYMDLDDTTGLTVSDGTTAVVLDLDDSRITVFDGSASAILEPTALTLATGADITIGGASVQGLSATTFTASFDDTSPKTLYTVTADETLFVEAVIARVTTVFDDGGSGAVEIGDGSDADGYLALNSAELQTTTTKGLAADERGALLWDGVGTHTIIDRAVPTDTIVATITPDGATQGEVEITILARRQQA